MNLMYPGIVEVKVIRKRDGASRIVTHSEMKSTLSAKEFERLSHEIFMYGEFEDSKHKVVIHKQIEDYTVDNSFM